MGVGDSVPKATTQVQNTNQVRYTFLTPKIETVAVYPMIAVIKI